MGKGTPLDPKKIIHHLEQNDIDTIWGITEALNHQKRTIKKVVKNLVELGIIYAVFITAGKKKIPVYKISHDFIPIWDKISH